MSTGENEAAWQALGDELAVWRDGGRRATLWWRDDDAVRPGPALEKLLVLAADHGVRPALAVIPQGVAPGLADWLAEQPPASLLQHGFAHRNHAPAGEKKAEFGADRPLHELLADAAMGRERMAALFPGRALPVFVPPWNRIAPALVPLLPHARIAGLSRFRARIAAQPEPGLTEANTHVDPVDWHGGRGFAGEAAALAALTRHLAARRAGEVDPEEPTGLLTHHALIDAAGWDFLARLLDVLAARDGADWLSAEEIFRLPP